MNVKSRNLVSATVNHLAPMYVEQRPNRYKIPLRNPGLFFSIPFALLVLLTMLCMFGCGGGYPGQGIASLTDSASTIDAGQTVTITAAMSGNVSTAWSIVTTNCGSAGCGTLSATSGTAVTYISPGNVTAPFQVVVEDSVSGTPDEKTVTITVNPDPTISGSPQSGTVGTAYSAQLTDAGGTGALKMALAGGALPAGLTFNAATGMISGTPSTPGTYNFVAQVTDSAPSPFTASANETIVVTAPGAALSLLGGNPPSGMVGTPYSTALVASGGTQPYTYTVLSGALPAGLTLTPSTGVISGIPTAQGTYTFTAQAQDAVGTKATAAFSITIKAGGAAPTPIVITISSLPNGTVAVPYNATIGVAGGTAPYGCTIVTGTLPAGLALGANCVVSGTPTVAGTANLTVKATDSTNPTQTTTGPVSLTINPAPSPLTITPGTLPNGTVGTLYSSTIGVTGGTGPYACTITSGTLPAGLALGANCLVSGTPTTAGTASLTVKATDSSNPQNTGSGPVSITIAPAASTLTITTGTLPNGSVGTTYSSTIGVTGGTAPYACTITSGTLPAGLALGANCLVSGTPTVAGTANLTVKATDASNPQISGSGPVSITILAAPVLVISNPPTGTVGTPYTGSVPVSGGTGPYTCSVKSGALPTGLTLNANCSISGTPTQGGTAMPVIAVVDSSNPPTNGSGPVSITINPAGAATLTVGNPPAATVGAPYTGTIPVAGGTAPYACTLASGTLPAGLTLNANCTISGTPTGTAGTSPIGVTVMDSTNPKNTVTAPVTVTVLAPPALSFTGTLPNATLNVPYSQTLTATGGVGPYTYAVTAGALPTGLTLSSGGVISGTPTAPGASAFTVTATDSEATPQTAALPLTLLVVYPTTATDSLLKGPYAYLFQGYDDVVAGVLAYQTAAVGSFTADGTGIITAGEQDANHQASNPTGTTVPTTKLLGTYTIGADDRGSLTLTTFNADGSVARTTTYAISVKAPVAPATTSARGSLIEFDNNQLVGTRGSGTFLAQTATAFTAGLSGNYAFGLQGDTPCLPACSVGIVAGPAAAVGQFTTAAGAISNGTGDTNIASTNYASSALTGTYAAADTNGRVQMSLTTSNMPLGVYPSDFAVYMVNANQAFVMSTDKHSAYVLLAGSATSQTTATFSNASLTGPYVGYEKLADKPRCRGRNAAERPQPVHRDHLPRHSQRHRHLHHHQRRPGRPHGPRQRPHRARQRVKHHQRSAGHVCLDGQQQLHGRDQRTRNPQLPHTQHAAFHHAHAAGSIHQPARAASRVPHSSEHRLLPRNRLRRPGQSRSPDGRPLHRRHTQRHVRLRFHTGGVARKHQCRWRLHRRRRRPCLHDARRKRRRRHHQRAATRRHRQLHLRPHRPHRRPLRSWRIDCGVRHQPRPLRAAGHQRHHHVARRRADLLARGGKSPEQARPTTQFERRTNMPRTSTFLALLFVTASTATSAFSQSMKTDPTEFVPRATVALGYDFTHANAPPAGCNCFGINGGFLSASVKYKFWLSFAGEMTGGHANNIGPLGQNLTLITYTGGPRITFRRYRTVLFAQGLVGGAHGSDSYFPTASSYSTSANTFAFSTGGGLDIEFTHNLAIRALEAQYLHTGFNNGVNSSQNQLMLGAGVVLKIHGNYAQPHVHEAPAAPHKLGMTCSADFRNVEPGQPLQVTAVTQSNADATDLLYDWKTDGGEITAHQASAMIDTTGLATGRYHVSARATSPSDAALVSQCDITFRVIPPPPISIPLPPPPPTTQAAIEADRVFHTNVPDVFFDYDKSVLRPDAQQAVATGAAYLLANPQVRVLLGGYSDERGTVAYNLALGEKRAETVRDALVAAGIASQRLEIVSYGKGAQLCTKENEECFQRNRRTAFLLRP